MVSGRWLSLALAIGLIFAHATALTSLGLAQATWNARPARAIAGSVLAYLMMTVGWSVFVSALGGPSIPYGPGGPYLPRQRRVWEPLSLANPFVGVSLANPFVGVSRATADVGNFHVMDHVAHGFWDDPRHAGFDHAPGWPLFWIGSHLAVAAVLLAATLKTFDHHLGRIPGRRDGSAAPRHGMPDGQARLATGTARLHPPWKGKGS